MEDAENNFLQSKKRSAGREISRDNPGLDDDEDSSEQDLGTFKKASEEILATRRIVKVRRGKQASSASSPPNPFANIRLVAPSEPQEAQLPTTASDVTDPEASGEETVSNDFDNGKTKSGDENGKAKEEDAKQSEDNEAEPKAEESKPVAEESNPEAEGPKPDAEEPKPEVDTEAVEKEEKTDAEEKKDVGSSTTFSSFQQLSSSQNAFTNLSGTGFSTSTFSFSSIKTDGSGFGSSSSSFFGLKTDQSPFGLGLGLNNNGSSSLFNNSGSLSSSAAASKNDPSAAAMKEVEVETGEENEEVVFNAESVLYEFIGGGWKERGKGEVKINVSKPEKEKARLVMRAKGNYRLILNASLFPDMKLTAMDKKGLSFACINSTGEETNGFSTFALKFKDPSVVEEFRGAFTTHKGKAVAVAPEVVAVLKTPENSPKASDE